MWSKSPPYLNLHHSTLDVDYVACSRFLPRACALVRSPRMSVQVTPHPAWVAHLDAALDPQRDAILETPVVVDASENRLTDGKIQNFLVAFYPIIRDFPQWLQLPRDRFQIPEPMIPETRAFHNYLTGMCKTAEFATAVGAVNYAVEGVAQKISEKALRGLGKNVKIGPRGRWWLEEHAKYDDEHPIHALEIIKACVAKGEDPDDVAGASTKSLTLMRESMLASYAA